MKTPISMIKYFAITLIIITGFILLKYYIFYLLNRKFSISKQKIIIILIEIIIFSLFLTILHALSEKYIQVHYILGSIFFALFATYSSTIKPLQYLMFNKSTDISRNIEKKITQDGFDYKIRLINRKNVNAFATGVLPFYKLILIDEKILKELTEEQILSIVYHEVGHHELNHLKKLLFIKIIFALLLFHIIRENPKNIFFVLFVIIIWSLLYYYIPNKIKYNFEFQADTFSSNINSKKNLIEALKKLDKLFNNRISKGGVSHPTLEQRIKNINNEK
jgi:Zn-dependent protease with chaperone function